MKNTYTSPRLADHGGIAEITGIFGAATMVDILVDPNGRIAQRGTGSIDACPTDDFNECIVGPGQER